MIVCLYARFCWFAVAVGFRLLRLVCFFAVWVCGLVIVFLFWLGFDVWVVLASDLCSLSDRACLGVVAVWLCNLLEFGFLCLRLFSYDCSCFVSFVLII